MSIQLPDSDQTFTVSQEHLSRALSQVSLGFWEVNLSEGNFMACTDQCKRNFGWPVTHTFSYQDMLAAILPEDLPGMQEKVRLAIRSARPYFAQYRVRHPDDALHWIEAQGEVLYEGNAPIKIIGTTIDITEKKNLEVLRDEMLSVTMHELKTPLSAVKGSLQILERHLEKDSDEATRRIASRALGSAERINRLLSEMAQPVMAQAKGIVLNHADFDLRRLAEEIAENTAMLHEKANIRVTAPDGPLPVRADRYRIGQVLTNLVNNGVKYSLNLPQVTIHLAAGDDHIAVRVYDKGLGIAKEDRHKVFQKFYRAANRRSVDGLGIGLFLCSEIVLRHGGKIMVEENDAPGTTMLFTLPYSG